MNKYEALDHMMSLCSGDIALDSLYLPYNMPSIELPPEYSVENGYIHIEGRVKYLVIDGECNNDVWRIGDYYEVSDGKLEQIPDSWHMEDLRQSEVIFRPVINLGKY